MILTTTDHQADLPRYFRRVFARARQCQRGRIDFHLPDGRVFRAQAPEAGPKAELHLHNSDTFARLARDGRLGFSEAYLDGWWSTPDLQVFLDFMMADNDALSHGFPGQRLVRAYERLRHWMRQNTRGQAKKNISYHYDLGNEFYALWLDKTMTYSSALFDTGRESLEVAQRAKYARMVDQLGVKAGDHVLEIGCGWGGFAQYAAGERGLRVTGLTLSQEQLNYARERIEKAGLSEMVNFKLQDYRDETGRYDGIASIEMFEAVGEKYWGTYFETLHARLRPGAVATLQIITLTEARFQTYRKSVDFIQKYIFPGGMLPSKRALTQQIERCGLAVVRTKAFGESYSKTLRRWHKRFNNKWEQVSEMGFDERFHRMWDFYLASCAAAFHSGNCDVVQLTVTRPK